MDNVNEAPPYTTSIQTETQIDTLTSDTLIFDISSGSSFQLDRGGHQSEQEQHQGGSGLADTLDTSVPPSHHDQSSLPRLDKQVEEYLETLAPLPATSSTLLNDADPFLSSSGRMFTSEPNGEDGFASHQEDTLVDYFNQTEGPLELERIYFGKEDTVVDHFSQTDGPVALQRIFYGNKTPRKIEVHCEPQDIVSPGHNTPGWYR